MGFGSPSGLGLSDCHGSVTCGARSWWSRGWGGNSSGGGFGASAAALLVDRALSSGADLLTGRHLGVWGRRSSGRRQWDGMRAAMSGFASGQRGSAHRISLNLQHSVTA